MPVIVHIPVQYTTLQTLLAAGLTVVVEHLLLMLMLMLMHSLA